MLRPRAFSLPDQHLRLREAKRLHLRAGYEALGRRCSDLPHVLVPTP